MNMIREKRRKKKIMNKIEKEEDWERQRMKR
jgi:hypothetical protein